MGLWFLTVRKAPAPALEAFPEIRPPLHVSPEPSPLFPGGPAAPAPDVEVLLKAGKDVSVEQVNRAMQALQIAGVVHVTVNRVDENDFAAQIVAPRGWPHQRVEEVVSRLRAAGVPRIEIKVVTIGPVDMAKREPVPRASKLITAEGEHPLTDDVSLFIESPRSFTSNQPGQRSYQIVWTHADATQTLRGYAPLTGEGEPFIAFWNQDTNCLWLGSSSYLARHELGEETDGKYRVWLAPSDIPKEIADIVPSEFASAVRSWYPKMPQH
jgi:hypothetical protein